MGKTTHHHFSIGTIADDEEEPDGIFNHGGVYSNFRSPSLPVSIPRGRWLCNFRGYFFSPPVHESEYDTTFRRRKQRHGFIVATLTVIVIVAMVAYVVYKGGDEIAEFKSAGRIVSHYAYRVEQHASIPEIQADLVLYRHKKTQAEILTIVPNDLDQDAVFGLSIKTLAENNMGASHVLMHSLWDGSNKFPLKDPVNEYHKGSLATFLEAQCLEDRTLYTAATRNRKDFNNLMSVMLDALFTPLVRSDKHKDVIFREEAWRLDPSDGMTFDGTNEVLQFNGQVLNMQKLVYSDVDEMITRYARRALFGNTRYQFDAQGTPAEIIELRKIDVQNFYNKHYAATNTQVFLYGSTDHIEDGLKAFDGYAKHMNTRLDKKEQSLAQWQQLNLDQAAVEIVFYPAEEDQDTGWHTMTSWLINESSMSQKIEFAWRVIEHLLVGTPTAVVRKKLDDFVESDLTTSNSTLATEIVGGLDTDYQQWQFSIGIKGIAHYQIKEAQDRIDSLLLNLKGFDKDALAAAMNVVEMKRRDLSSGHKPRGVLLFRQALTHWNYNKEPKDTLAWSAGWKELQDDISKNGDKFLIALIQKQLVQNTHKVHVQLSPSTTELSKRRDAEKKRLLRMRETEVAQDFQKILDESKDLQDKLKSPDAPDVYDTLPKIELSEIGTKNAKPQAHFSMNRQVLIAETPVTSSFGMVFVDYVVDLRTVNYDDIALLPLVYRLMLETGTKTFDQEQLINQIGKFSTGITAESMILDVHRKGVDATHQYSVHDGTHLATKVVFRGRCMVENLEEYFVLLGEIIFNGRNFVKDEVVEIVNRMIDEEEAKIVTEGDRIAAFRLGARYSYQGVIEEQLHGMHQVQSLHKILLDAYVNWEGLLGRLERVHKGIVEGHRSGMLLGVTGEKDLLSKAAPLVDHFISDGIPNIQDEHPCLEDPGEVPHSWIPKVKNTMSEIAPFTNEAMIVETPLDYVGKGGLLYSVGQAVDGSAAVVSKYMERVYLYHELHEKRGVDDVFVEFSFRHGTLLLISSKDPHLSITLDVFDAAANGLAQSLVGKDLSAEAHSAIVGTIADLDGPAKQPDEIGRDSIVDYLQDDNSDFAQLRRTQILNTTRQNFVDFFHAFSEWKSSSVAVVSDRQAYLDLKRDTNMELVQVCQHWTCNLNS